MSGQYFMRRKHWITTHALNDAVDNLSLWVFIVCVWVCVVKSLSVQSYTWFYPWFVWVRFLFVSVVVAIHINMLLLSIASGWWIVWLEHDCWTGHLFLSLVSLKQTSNGNWSLHAELFQSFIPLFTQAVFKSILCKRVVNTAGDMVSPSTANFP